MAETVTKICGLLRRKLGHDFSEYKRNTVIRRVQRRMQVLQIHNPTDYFDLLRRTPIELDLLFRELLISVTGFFRDPAAFAALQPVIRDVVSSKDTDDQIRVWMPAMRHRRGGIFDRDTACGGRDQARGGSAQVQVFCDRHRRAGHRDGESSALPQIAARRNERWAAGTVVRQRG